MTLGPPWDFNLAMSNGGMMGGYGGGNSWQIESKGGGGGGTPTPIVEDNTPDIFKAKNNK